jgi:hypothetical protein
MLYLEEKCDNLREEEPKENIGHSKSWASG